MPTSLPKHAHWLSQTSVAASFRSDELKAVDKALLNHERAATPANLEALKKAFFIWKHKDSREGNWTNSARNKKGAVTELVAALNPNSTHAMPATMRSDLQNAREGLIYLFSKLEVGGGWISAFSEGGVGLVNGLVGLNQTQDKIGTELGQLGSSIGSELLERNSNAVSSAILIPHKKMGVGDVMSAIAAWAKDYVRNLVQKVVDGFRSFAGFKDLVSDLYDYGQAATKLALGYLLPKLAPFVGAGIDMFNGVREIGSALTDRFSAWWRQRNVNFVSGHPGVIFSQIETAMTVAAGKGLWSALKGAGSFTGEALSFGATSLVSMLVTVAEFITKMVLRYVEQQRMRSFFETCKPEWQKIRVARSTGTGGTSALVEDAVGFGHWYQEACFAMPCLSMVALKSGIVGDKMRMISMYTGRDGNQVINQKTFDSGVSYIDGLKTYGMNYLNETGFKFTSRDPMVNNLVNRLDLNEQMNEVELEALTVSP